MLGHRQKGAALLTLTETERKTRQEHIIKIKQKTTEAVSEAIQQLKGMYKTDFPAVFKTITSDNGSEFSQLTKAMDCTQVNVYLCSSLYVQ